MPEVSVVMSVYNSSTTLAHTLDSVLCQEGVDLEFIVIDDGSTDATQEILDELSARDARLRVFHQENVGLTRSLIRGCEAARGEFIARQDAGGDLSLDGRLRAQVEGLRLNPNVALVSSGARFVGPKNEFLYEVAPVESDLTEGLQVIDPKAVRGPAHHGSTMFRRADYLTVGGYRPQFAVAQDLDLWLRLAEIGTHLPIHRTAYQAKVTPGSISQSKRSQQVKITRIIVECARRRREGGSEEPLLRKAAHFKIDSTGRVGRLARSSALYFIGSCLEAQTHRAGRDYFLASLQQFPLHLKSWWRLLFGAVWLG